MELVGMLDSPYVRRVAVSLGLMGLPFQLRPLSVFSTFDQFRAINPVVKAPTLITDGGAVLMDSSLILDYAEQLPGKRRSLMPADLDERVRVLRVTGFALAACEKAVQLVYERKLRPADKQHAPWLQRVQTQLQAACDALEAELVAAPLPSAEDTMDQAGVSTAIAWLFIQKALQPGDVAAERLPALAAHSASAEALPAFVSAPFDSSGWKPL